MTATPAVRTPSTATPTIEAPEWEIRRELTLAAIPSAISCAQMLMRHAFINLQVNRERVAIFERVAGDMVEHSVKTTGVSDTLPLFHSAFDRLTLIVLRLRITPQYAQIEVWDRGSEPPLPQLSQSRGIAMADNWGYARKSSNKRVVWCAVSISPPTEILEDDNPLPKRLSRPKPLHEPRDDDNIQRDPALLQRVLNGLRGLAPAAEQTKGTLNPTTRSEHAAVNKDVRPAVIVETIRVAGLAG